METVVRYYIAWRQLYVTLWQQFTLTVSFVTFTLLLLTYHYQYHIISYLVRFIMFKWTYIYLWSVKCYYIITDQEYKRKFEVRLPLVKARWISKWLRYQHHIRSQTSNPHYDNRIAIPTNIKIAKSGARFVGSFMTLSVLERLCGCSGHWIGFSTFSTKAFTLRFLFRWLVSLNRPS
jgi:hypothetical protein